MSVRGGRARLAGLALLAGAGAFEAAWAETWLTYVNPRFGIGAEYPSIFTIRDEPPENGDGQRFRTADRRATLAVYGFFRVEDEPPSTLRDRYRQAGTDYTYAAANGSSFVLSGTRGDTIVYLRCLRSPAAPDIFGCVDLEYPRAEARIWDPIVTRISASLRSLRTR